LIEEAANELYGGNVSRYPADAGLFYAGVLLGQKELEKSTEER
jgi:hypothetical protein